MSQQVWLDFSHSLHQMNFSMPSNQTCSGWKSLMSASLSVRSCDRSTLTFDGLQLTIWVSESLYNEAFGDQPQYQEQDKADTGICLTTPQQTVVFGRNFSLISCRPFLILRVIWWPGTINKANNYLHIIYIIDGNYTDTRFDITSAVLLMKVTAISKMGWRNLFIWNDVHSITLGFMGLYNHKDRSLSFLKRNCRRFVNSAS